MEAPASKPVMASKTVTSKPVTRLAPRSMPTDNDVAQLARQLADLKATVDTLEKERDFYFGKLREIEIIMQQHEADAAVSEVRSKVQKILYSTEEGFEVPETVTKTELPTQHEEEIF